MRITLSGWLMDIDEEANREWYARAEKWDGDPVSRNFLAQTEQALAAVAPLLERFGVQPEKPCYLACVEEKEDRYLYQVRYPLAGWLVKKGQESRFFSILDPEETAEPDRAEHFPGPRMDVELFAWLPWVLEESPACAAQGHEILLSSELEEDTAWAETLLQKVIPAALDAEGVQTPCEVDVLLTDDEGIHAINMDMRQVDRATDVLSFPMFDYVPGQPPVDDGDADPASGLTPLGDMVLSLERAQAQAQEFGHSRERELAYLAVHSVLHLLGYDHLDEGPEKARMRAREEFILSALGITRED